VFPRSGPGSASPVADPPGGSRPVSPVALPGRSPAPHGADDLDRLGHQPALTLVSATMADGPASPAISSAAAAGPAMPSDGPAELGAPEALSDALKKASHY
jgi:hypothetical protein